jgi:hypothetical protein
VNDNIEGTGPLECVICDTNGSINGVFIGYCIYCADVYHSIGEHRGNGMIEPGLELSFDNYDFWREETITNIDNIHETLFSYMGKGAFDTYLKNIDIKEFEIL